jgi:hypothetical protein
MNDLAQFQSAFNGVNTLLAVSTNIETEQITNGNLKFKGRAPFVFFASLVKLKAKVTRLWGFVLDLGQLVSYPIVNVQLVQPLEVCDRLARIVGATFSYFSQL